MKIHPTAIVDPKAEIHESVEIGPYSVIDKDVTINEGSFIDSNVRIYSGTKIGKFNKIFHGTALGGLPQDISFKPETKTHLIIGDGNTFRESCFFHRASNEGHNSVVGNNNYIMGNVHMGHDCSIGNNNIIAQGTVLGGHLTIGNKVFLSALVGVHQFVSIGDYAMVAGLAKIVKDIPPYTTVDGNPATVIGLNSVGLKRASFSTEIRNEIKRAYKVIYHSGLNTTQALTELDKLGNHCNEVKEIISFFKNSKRGVTDHRKIL